jgi:environmental stress-induced protein Ves
MSERPRLHTVALASAAEQPWRNGGGTTRELLAWPEGAGSRPDTRACARADAWRVRVSVAQIERSGRFSVFPGVQRWFTVLAGAGVQLRWAASSVDLAPGDEPVRFDGADAPDCALLGDPTLDLNLMLRGRGGMEPARVGEPWHAPGAAWRGLYAKAALQLHTATGVHRLAADTLAWSDSDGSDWQVQAQGTAAPLPAWWLHLEGRR